MLNIKRFILGRITRGFLSALLTYMITKIFKINIEIFNNVKFNYHFVVNDLTLFVSMFKSAFPSPSKSTFVSG